VTERTRSQDTEKFYEPVARFLAGLGIDLAAAQAPDDVEKFAEVILAALKKVSSSDYVYCQMIENKTHNSKYALYFISHHIFGAQKFLEAQSELKKRTATGSGQSTFDFIMQYDPLSILKFVKSDQPYDNTMLYEQGIKAGLCPTELNSQLKRMEKEAKIEIKELPGKKRNRGGLYIDYKHFKAHDRIITVEFMR
jgi:hypothetical protein